MTEELKRFQCIRRCYAGEYLWEVGMVFDGAKAPSERHFEVVKGYTPFQGGMYNEKTAIIMELESMKVKFNRTWPVRRLRRLLDNLKDSGEETDMRTKSEILSDRAEALNIERGEEESDEELEKRIEEETREAVFNAPEDKRRELIKAELKKLKVPFSKYTGTAELAKKLREAIDVEHTIESMQSGIN